ncbi:alpha/beta hydrolase [Antrihabitans cavernicola]|uniref:Alpha/beta hydrolase n=1 Tax=Antrihabitans cavernicola TaxID=2495913 RepID=A0A5A7S6I8_9NOCA|nr:alpha/beta hydrolase [Spelaeibacter cavernicola]
MRSQDGTVLAVEKSGDGPPLVIVLGAFNSRATHADFAAAAAEHFTVYNYDRRGRGESGDAAEYSVDLEVQDLAAVLAAAGGEAAVFGYSSGAVLALRAAAEGLPISQLVLYEPPPADSGALAARLRELIADGRRGAAVELFQVSIGLPEELVVQLRDAPFRPGLEAMAHTLVYDTTITSESGVEYAAAVTVPARVLAGGASPSTLQESARAVADALPNGSLEVLPDQTHDVVAAVVVPELVRFLAT